MTSLVRYGWTAWLLAGAVACSAETAPTSKGAVADSASGAADAAGADAATSADTAVEVAEEPTVWRATLTKTDKVSLWYSQGIAKVPGGWVFSHAAGLFRTDEALVEQLKHETPLPDDLKKLNFIHIGDIDAVSDVVYAGLEQKDYAKKQQAVAWFDAATLTVQGYQLLAQHQCSWLAVEPTPTIAYTMDNFDDDTVLRYDAAVQGKWVALAPLKMSKLVKKVQGGDIAQGALWLSTDDETHGLYRVDLQTGQVDDLGSLGHNNGTGLGKPEGEGIDATLLDGALLHTLTGEPLKLTSWVDHFAVHAPTKGK